MRHYLGIMMSPPQETDEWSFQNFSNGFKQVMLTHPQFNDIGKTLTSQGTMYDFCDGE